MVQVQQLSWGDGALGAPWLSLTGGTETRPRVWGAFPIVPSTRGSRLHGPGGATCALCARPGRLLLLSSGLCLFFAVYF